MDGARRTILIVVGALLALGLVMVYSASFVAADKKFGSATYFLQRHAVYLLAGCLALAITSILDYHRLARQWKWLLAISFVILAAVLVPGLGVRLNGARRWFAVAGLTFQPSEAAKVLMILGLSGWIVHVGPKIQEFKAGFVPGALLTIATAGLIGLEPDLGSAALLFVVLASLLFVAGVRVRHALPVALVTLPVIGALAYFKFGHLRARIETFLSGAADPLGSGYQITQAMMAQGSGGIYGAGLGQGHSKLLFLPEAHNDFIFALIAEELGLIGTLSMLTLFVVFVVQGWRVARRAPDMLGSLIALGVTLCIGLQAAINIAVVTHSMPTKGIALPFVSYGGSSLILTLAAVGLLLNVAAHPACDAIPETLGAVPKKKPFSARLTRQPPPAAVPN